MSHIQLLASFGVGESHKTNPCLTGQWVVKPADIMTLYVLGPMYRYVGFWKIKTAAGLALVPKCYWAKTYPQYRIMSAWSLKIFSCLCDNYCFPQAMTMRWPGPKIELGPASFWDPPFWKRKSKEETALLNDPLAGTMKEVHMGLHFPLLHSQEGLLPKQGIQVS